MKREAEIDLSIRELSRKFIFFNVLIFVVAVSFSMIFSAHFKRRLGGQLASASRDALISGDSRRAIVDLTSTVGKDFSGMSWLPAEGGEGFILPSGTSFPAYRHARAAIKLFFDDKGAFEAGEMVFYYSRWTPALWGLAGWLGLFALSIPVALRERNRLIRDYNLLLELKVKESYSTLAAQVAHDIRSPLAALGAAARGLEAAPRQRQVIAGAVERIQGIADDLLQRYRSPGEVRPAAAVACDLVALAAQVVEEKRLQYAGRSGLELSFVSAAGEAAALADPKEFQRIVSNLINNSVEALGGPGQVSVSLFVPDALVVLEVKDNGRGIPPETLSRLCQKGETHGKAGGTGLGLYHARTSAENWGGGLEITSEAGRGTTVTMRLPAAADPGPAAAPRRAVLIDDDPLTHMTWELAAQAKGVELLAFTAPGDFLARLAEFPKDLPIYIDSDLGGGIKGENIAADLRAKGYTALSLATGHLPEKFVHLPWLKVQSKEPPWG